MDKEAKRLADLLAKPVIRGDEVIRFTNLEQASQYCPEIAALCKKSKATMPALHTWLLHKFPNFQYEPEDRVPKLTPSTLKGRRQCAAVWRGERPWFKRQRVVGTRTCTVGTAKEQKAAKVKPVYWNPKWYGLYAFMLDATSFSNREGPMHTDAPRVYSDRNNVYPPTPVAADKSISQTCTIMVYAAIHKHFGLVVGPDIIYTGTKLKHSKMPKEKQFEQEGVKTWYDSVRCASAVPQLWYSCSL